MRRWRSLTASFAMSSPRCQRSNAGDLCRELGVTRQTLYRHVGPNLSETPPSLASSWIQPRSCAAWPTTIILAGRIASEWGVTQPVIVVLCCSLRPGPEFGRTSSYDIFPTTVVPLFVAFFRSSSRSCGNGVTGRCTVSTTPETWMLESGRERLERASCCCSRFRRADRSSSFSQ
jgi:hypothetical protein